MAWLNTMRSWSCRRLGVPKDASFEEVQDARDFLFAVSAVLHAALKWAIRTEA